MEEIAEAHRSDYEQHRLCTDASRAIEKLLHDHRHPFGGERGEVLRKARDVLDDHAAFIVRVWD